MSTQSGRGDLVKKDGVPGVQRTAASAKERKLTAKQATALERLSVRNLYVTSKHTEIPLLHTTVSSAVSVHLVRNGFAHRLGTGAHRGPAGRLGITEKGIAAIRAHTGKSWLGMKEGQISDHVLQLKRILNDAKLDQNTQMIDHITNQLQGIAKETEGPSAVRLRRRQALLEAAQAKAELYDREYNPKTGIVIHSPKNDYLRAKMNRLTSNYLYEGRRLKALVGVAADRAIGSHTTANRAINRIALRLPRSKS